MQILLSMSRIPSRSSPMSPGDASPVDPPRKWHRDIPELCAPPPYPHCPHPMAGSLFTPSVAVRANFGRGLVNTLKKLAESVDQRETTNFSFSSDLGKAKGRLWAHGLGCCRMERRHPSQNAATRGSKK